MRKFSDSPAVAPDPDMEPVAVAPAAIQALGCEGVCVAVEFGGGPAFGHQQDPLGWNAEAVDECLDFGEVIGGSGDEFEPGIRVEREVTENLGH